MCVYMYTHIYAKTTKEPVSPRREEGIRLRQHHPPGGGGQGLPVALSACSWWTRVTLNCKDLPPACFLNAGIIEKLLSDSFDFVVLFRLGLAKQPSLA